MIRSVCVCVPARDEAARLPRLIAALASQTHLPASVAICVNNSVDGTAEAARAAAAEAGMRISIDERWFAPTLAHAGSARRAAMDLGAASLRSDCDVLVSTDADCRPPASWIASILSAIEDDLIVGGAIVIDPDEGLAPTAARIRRRWDRYWQDVRAIEDGIDPRPWDHPPRHGDHTGASLAMTVGLYGRAGGVPPLASGEDRALVENAVAAGGRLAHPASVWTRVSPRTEGRATGGMAADMAALARIAESGSDPLAPSFARWRHRARWRRATRARFGDAALAARERLLPPLPCDMILPDLT